MIFINFKPITIADKQLFDKYFWQRRYENAHFNFTNLFMWRKAYDIQWCEQNDILFVKAGWEGDSFFLQPFCYDALVSEALDIMLVYAQSLNKPFKMYGVEKDMTALIDRIRPDLFKITAVRDNFDYVYLTDELINLQGRKFHAKKNHVNNFHKNYPGFEYCPLNGSEELINQCIAMAGVWKNKRSRDSEMAMWEHGAILDALANFDRLGLTGAAIKIDGKVEAFTFGEKINNDTAVIHVEKANPEIKGLYAAINQEFCRHAWADTKFINREEDMGIEGLRRAKLSYRPVKMVEKFSVEIMPERCRIQ